jgi:hypothetical protein
MAGAITYRGRLVLAVLAVLAVSAVSVAGCAAPGAGIVTSLVQPGSLAAGPRGQLYIADDARNHAARPGARPPGTSDSAVTSAHRGPGAQLGDSVVVTT